MTRKRSTVRSLPVATVATALIASALVVMSPGVAMAAGSTLFDQPFHNSSADGQGAVAIPGMPDSGTNIACLTASGNPGTSQPQSCASALDTPGAGKLRLTDAGLFETGGLFAAASMPISLGLDVTFNMYQYGGTKADGIAMTVAAVDPAEPVSPENIGQTGGALGYSATGTSKGLAHGYMGFGFDVYGNFSSNVYEGTGCTDPAYISSGTLVPGQVVIRGPGHGFTGYCAINSTATSASPPSAVVPIRGDTRAVSKVPAEVVINPSASTLTTASGLVSLPNTYQLVFTPVGQATRTLTGTLPTVPDGLYPARWINSRGYPKQLAFGWVGSTGASTDFHEVDATHVTTLSPLPAPALVVSQTGYTETTLAAGDPVTFTVTAGVDQGTTEPAPITVTETLPAGLVPVAAYGTDWDCSPPVGQTISCVNTNVPFPAGTTLPVLTITATVTAATMTPATVQTYSIVSASSRDATTVYGGETGWRNAGDAPLRGVGTVYSNSTIVSASKAVSSCTNTWPLPVGTTDCNGIYIDGSVIAQKACTGQIVTPSAATETCNTGVHTTAGDDPAIASPAAYAQPVASVALQTLPTCSTTSSIVAFTPGYYDDAVSLSALTGGATACRNKTFWFAPGVYYFDFRNSTMPTSGGPVIPNGSDIWTFNDATSVIVGGTKQGWSTSGITAASLPGACVSPLTSTTAQGVQFVFGADSQFYQQAGSVELCGTYSATKPPITVSGATGAGGSTSSSAVLLPSALSAFSSAGAPVFAPVTSVAPITSLVDGNAGPAVTNVGASSTATLRIGAVSGQTSGIPARSVLDSAKITVRHGDMNAAIGTTLKLIFTSSRAASDVVVKYLTLSRTTSMVYSTQVIDVTDELSPDVYGFGGDPFTLDVVLTTSSAAQAATEQVDYLKMDIAWRSAAVRPQSGCVTTVNGCAAFSSTSAGTLANELYFQGTVYMPAAKMSIGLRTAHGSVFADGVIVRAFVLDSDAYAGTDVYDGNLLRVPNLGSGIPLLVYLTAWTCASGSCAQPPSTAAGWRISGRTLVQYIDVSNGVVSGQRDVDIQSWQVAR